MSAEHDVFISYSAKNKAFADAVCSALEGRKIRCWIAPRDVRAGIPYAEALIEALDGCRVMVLLLSASSNTSPQVMREVERAASRGAYIIPVRIEDIALSPSLQFFIGPIHWIDALTPPIEQHLDYLAETVGYVLRRMAKGAQDLTPKEIPAAPAQAIQAGPAPAPQASPIPAPFVPPATAEGGSSIGKIEPPPSTEVPPTRPAPAWVGTGTEAPLAEPAPAAVQPSIGMPPARPVPAAIQASTDVPPTPPPAAVQARTEVDPPTPVPAAVQTRTEVFPAPQPPAAVEKRRAALPVLPLMMGAFLGVVLVAMAGAGIYWVVKSHQDGRGGATPPPPASQTPMALPFSPGTKPPAVPAAGQSGPDAPARIPSGPSAPATTTPVVPTPPATKSPTAPPPPADPMKSATKAPVVPTPPATKPPAALPAPPTKPAAKLPAAPPTKPATKPPVAPTPPAPKPPVLVQSVPTQMKLISTSATRVPAGGKVTFDLTFMLMSNDPVPAEDNLAWRSPDGQLHYGEYTKFTASPGANTRHWTFTVGPSRPPGTELPLFGVIRIHGAEYRTQVPVLLRVAAAGLVDQLRLMPTSTTRISPGGKVNMDLTFVLTGSESLPAEWNLAVRGADGTLSYMRYLSFTASPGPNKVPVIFSTTTSRPPGDIPLVGVVRINGTVYHTQVPVFVRVAAAGLVDQLRLVPTSATQAPPGGKVTFDLTFTLTATGSVPAEWDFALRSPDGTLNSTSYLSVTATPGANMVHAVLTVGTGRLPGTTVLVYGVIRINGTVYQTQEAVPVQIVAR